MKTKKIKEQKQDSNQNVIESNSTDFSKEVSTILKTLEDKYMSVYKKESTFKDVRKSFKKFHKQIKSIYKSSK